MKIVSLLLSLCLASVALAEDPAELVKLRQIWKNSVAEATKSAEETYRSKNIKANKLYYAELNEMKKNFMTAQNLNGANAVDAELKKLKALHGKQRFEAPKEEKLVVKTKEILEGMVGDYEAQESKNMNDWHFGNITIEERNKQGCPVVLRWKNKAGKTWLLFPDLVEGVLRTSLDNPYYNDLRIKDLKMRHQCRNYEIVFNEKGDGVIGFNRNGFHKLMK